MNDAGGSSESLPEHIEETLRSISRLNAEHHESATLLQRAVDRITAVLSRPWLLAVLAILVTGWMGLNMAIASFGGDALDPPPFSWLAAVTSLASLFIAVLILASQRREDQLAGHRELLILELSILSEQKIAKVIQLLEESRRDNPMIQDRLDKEAETMAQPADPKMVLEVITDTRAKAAQPAECIEIEMLSEEPSRSDILRNNL